MFASIVKASPIDPQSAIQVAKQFVPKSTAQRAPMRGSRTDPSSSIVYTHMMPNSDRPAFYIVNVDDGAFVLVSADDIAHQVLGYSLSSAWPVAKDGSVELPDHIKGFFDDLAAQMEAAVEAEPTRAAGSYKASQRSTAPNRSPSLPDSVGPLLTTTWNQGQYYNALCPEDANGPDGHVYTGCVATAMAQIIKYWSYSTPGRGTHSYSTDYGTLTVNYSEASYEYASMPNALDENSTQDQINAVARLMYHCGVATNMQYGANESSSYDRDARAGLINFYRFSPNLSYAEKSFFTETDWNDLLHQEIAANRPVLYSGFGDSGGHTFVCDGYKADNYYHFNFGWGGFCDGWYLTSVVNPNGLNYNSSQTAIVGIVPDESGNVILGQTTGNSIFTVDEPLEFYNLMGHNAYKGSNYTNLCDNTVTFIPADNSKQMVADIMEFEDQRVRIYNGGNTNNLLSDLIGGNENNLSPVVSTENALTINYSGNMYAGFKLNISQNNGRRMVSNIVSSIEATTIHLMWTENGTATQWQIEYAFKGFELGKGVVYNTLANTATFENLEKFTEYDFYIRSVYGDNQYGPWNKATVMIEAPYWQDVVTSQPEGYLIDESSHCALISCAEDFVWYLKNYNGYNARFIADIDLNEYKWRPVEYSGNHVIDGNGHKITNLYINELDHFAALFSSFFSEGTIKNLGIESSKINSTGHGASGFCGDFYGVIDNCFISNSTINGRDVVGGFVARNFGTITNCYSNAEVFGTRWVGLLSGYSGGTINNCYAAGSIQMRSYCYYAGISAYAATGLIRNCYSVDSPMGVIGFKGETIISDTSSFYRNGNTLTLCTPIAFESSTENDLSGALNKWVEQNNDSSIRMWTIDQNTNNGLPVFGDYYVVQCPNVSNLTIQNIKKNNVPAVVVNWEDPDNAITWEIKYQPVNTPNDSAIIVPAISKPDTLYGFSLGREYTISVRCYCDETNHSGWTSKREMIDLPFWTDIVTTQPDGYVVDNEGNVTISSVEGLAWLSAVVNGLHGNVAQTFEGKTISLMSDIDLQGYRWFPIGRGWGPPYSSCFNGIFQGNGHTISNMYVNSYGPHLGLFGYSGYGTTGTTFSDVNLVNGSVNCYYNDNTDGGFGGLVGTGVGLKEITNCNSSIVVSGNKSSGSLCGWLNDDDDNPTIVSNCSATGDVYGREASGGLIGEARGVFVRNCYATGDVFLNESGSNAWYRGGLIGNFMSNSSVRNCYSTGNVEMGEGRVIGCPYLNSTTHYVYGLNNNSTPLVGASYDEIADTASFVNMNGHLDLITPVTINGSAYDNLLDVLNAWVANINDQTLKTWVSDTSNVNGGYPVFGDYYEPTCYNPTNVRISNATIIGDTIIRTKIEWEQEGNSSSWDILYVGAQQSIERGTIIRVDSNPCELTNLPVGEILDFYVRARKNDDTISGWSNYVRYIPDIVRWTEVVTSQPDGYVSDDNGNVYISSAEGLAWLSSVLNGLNGNSGYSDIRNIYLTSDIDLSTYRWTSIGNHNNTLYNLLLEGNNHTISGLYCNEYADNQGLFGSIDNSIIQNLSINGSLVKGLTNNGTIAGEAGGTISNCVVNGEIYGVMCTGGVVGRSNGRVVNIFNTAFIGMVDTRWDITVPNCYNGFVGGITGSQFGATITNVYVSSSIPTSSYSGIIAGDGTGEFCYLYAQYYPTTLNFVENNTNTNSSFFIGSGTTWILNTPPYIGDSFHTDLVDALNAWVDANNTEDKYRYWAADTENVNGGYPIIAPLPRFIVAFKNANGDTLQIDTLEYGSRPLYFGDCPILESTAQYDYTFKEWSTALNPVTEDVIFTAVYDSIVKKYILTYKLDGEDYKKETLAYNATITPLAALTKEGYTFSGWSNIPVVMPANDVVVIGSFTVNKYLFSVLIDGVVVYSDSIAYGTRLADYADLIKEKGIDISQWEWYSQIETITMPAHDVVINAVLDSIKPIRRDVDENVIYDLTGKKIVTDDISTLPSGIYIRNGRKFMVP